MRRALDSIFLATFVVAAATSANAQTSSAQGLWGGQLVHKVDSLATLQLEDGPVASLAIGIKRGQHLLLAKGYGEADIENGVPATPETVYRIGSITKQFTAAAVMQLVEQGKIGLDDPMTRFLPDFPMQGHTVTIRHLLTHTSGIKSYTGLDAWRPTMKQDLSDEELVAFFKDEPFDFAPGERFLYNNSGFYLLGMIVAKVSGEPYRDYLKAHIFGPLGMTRSSYCDEKPIIRGRAEGYQREGGTLVNDDYLSMNQPGAAGALCSTVLDLLSWSAALRSGTVVSPDSYRQMTTSATLNNDSATSYGFGLGVGDRDGHPTVAHGGGINGFNTMLAHYPEADLDIVVLSNTNGPHAGRVAETIAKWALGIPIVAVRDLTLSADQRRTYQGTYRLRPGLDLRIFADGDRLMAEATGQGSNRLRFQGDHVFIPTFDDDVRIVFTVERGRATKLVLHQGGQTMDAPRVANP